MLTALAWIGILAIVPALASVCIKKLKVAWLVSECICVLEATGLIFLFADAGHGPSMIGVLFLLGSGLIIPSVLVPLVHLLLGRLEQEPKH
jgi:hypothetical protein